MMTREKKTIQQLPIPSRSGYDAILNSSYLDDILQSIVSWKSRRVVLVHSKALDSQTSVVKDLRSKLGPVLAATKCGVGAHSPYSDVIEITQLLHTHDADCLIGVGSSSYSDACKIARLLHTTLPPDITVSDVEKLVNQESGLASDLKEPCVKLILVPTSLSASEWNHISSATNPETQKKQHFGTENSMPDLILLDPNVARTSPRKLWLSSGMRAVDHCVETICNERCTPEAEKHMCKALAILLRGLKEYKEGENDEDREEFLDGIAECQAGSREAMMGLLICRIPMGPSHAIGHQLGSVCGVMHGVTSCIVLAPVLRYMSEDPKSKEQQKECQKKLLGVFNKTLDWDEKSAADAVRRFVRFLELPASLKEAGVNYDMIETVSERTLTDVLASGIGKDDVLRILESAKS